MQNDPRKVFQNWLDRRTGQSVDPEDFSADEGNLERYVARYGLPRRIISEPWIRVAAYNNRFVGEVRDTGSVLVCQAWIKAQHQWHIDNRIK